MKKKMFMTGDNEVRKSSESQKVADVVCRRGDTGECGLIHQANASCGAKKLEVIPDRCEGVDWPPTESYPCVFESLLAPL